MWFKLLGYGYNFDLWLGISLEGKVMIIANIFPYCLNLLLTLKFPYCIIKNIPDGRLLHMAIIRTFNLDQLLAHKNFPDIT
jgi:hypothetical protein